MGLSSRCVQVHRLRRAVLVATVVVLHGLCNEGRAQQALHESAQAAERDGRIDTAIQFYTEAIDAGRLSADELVSVYYSRASLWAKLCENGRAIEDFSQSIALNPDYGYAYSLRGYLRGASGQYDLAEQDHLRAIELADAGWEQYLPWVLQHQADLQRRRGDFRRALETCDEALRSGDFAITYFRRAWIYLDLRDYPSARAEFDKFVARAEQQAVPLNDLWPDEGIALERMQRMFGRRENLFSPAGAWNVSGTDDRQTAWIATLVLTRSERGELAGHFDWIGNNGHCGREFVTARFDPRSRLLEITGSSVANEDLITPGRYRCRLSDDGLLLKDGQWLGVNVIPGEWAATRIEVP